MISRIAIVAVGTVLASPLLAQTERGAHRHEALIRLAQTSNQAAKPREPVPARAAKRLARPPSSRKAARPYVNLRKVSERRGYKKVSSLADLPNFMPGLGVLYVRPATLPNGPFLAFDRKDKLVSTIYMIPVEDIAKERKFDLTAIGAKGDHVTLHFNPGHPGVQVPHYHVIVWHVDKRGEARVAQ
jgi:hypothetical protein